MERLKHLLEICVKNDFYFSVSSGGKYVTIGKYSETSDEFELYINIDNDKKSYLEAVSKIYKYLSEKEEGKDVFANH